MVRLKEGYTLNNVFDTPTLATVTVTPLGYKKPEAFYAPKYETSAAKADNNPDLRTTVYWDPSDKPDCRENFADLLHGRQSNRL